MEGPTDLFQCVDPSWVRASATGLMLLIPGMALHVVGAAFRIMDAPRPKGLCHIAGAVLVAMGAMLATRKERKPGVNMSESGRVVGPSAMATWVRVLALASLVLWLLLGTHSLRWWGNYDDIPKVPVLLVLLCQGVMAALLAYLVSALATRVPDDSVSTQAIYSGWGTAAVCFTLFMIQWLELTTSIHMMFFTCSFPMIGGFLVILAWASVTLLRLALAMRTAAAIGSEMAARRVQRLADWSQ
jgi:hypothetical protein